MRFMVKATTVVLATACASATVPFTTALATTTVGQDGATHATPVCGVSGGELSRTQPIAPVSPKELIARGAMGGFAVAKGVVYALDRSHGTLVGVRTDGTTVSSLATPDELFTVDPDGNSYVRQANYDLVKRDPRGAELWRAHLPSPINSIGGVTGSAWRLVLVLRSGTAELDPQTGSTLAAAPAIQGRSFSSDGEGGLLSVDDHYVRRYDASLREVTSIGSTAGANDAMPDGAALHFSVPGGAARLSDGRLLVTDTTKGIWVLDPSGAALGLASSASLGGIPQNANISVIDDTVAYTMGSAYSTNQTVGTLPLATVLALAGNQPLAAGPRLGVGAGVSTGVPGNYFRPGDTPRLTTAFDPGWKHTPGLAVSYSVRDAAQVASGASVATQTLALSAADIDSGRSLTLPAATPGAYEVEVRLSSNGQPLSATCVHYSVAAPGMPLDLSALPGGAGAGGPDGPRGVALADDLGLGAARLALDWRNLLAPDGSTDFSKYDAEVQAAAAEAARRHVLLSVQLGSGGPERAFVDNGTWGARVQAVIAHFAPYVDYWEPWNEPNISYGTATNYVRNILHPFSEAVKAADPTAKRIGGTVVGVGYVPYWDEIVRAGGLDDMDIAAIHPYPGHNRSFEEEGFAAKIQQTKAAFAAGGKPDLPIWITEFAFWSNGPADWFGQADKSVRAKVISQSLGIDNWEYFLAQGTWGNDGVTFSAIEGDQVVKPAAVALMAARTALQGRAFERWVPTGTPHVLVARYGPRRGGTDSVLVAWSDDAAVPMVLRGGDGHADLADEYGRPRTLTVGSNGTLVTLTGSVQYISVPPGSDLTLAPLETWGPDVALASAGATATATSHNPLNIEVKAIDGEGAANGQGDFRSSSAWASAPGDAEPALTVNLRGPTALDRVVYATGGLGSVQSGIRDADIDVQTSDGTWQRVGLVRDAFAQRTSTVTFPVVTASAIRLTVRSVNLGGYNGGAAPWFWPTDTSSLSDGTQPWYGPAIVREIEAYGPGDLASPTDPDAPAPPTPSAPPSPPVTTPPTSTPLPAPGTSSPAPGTSALSAPPSPPVTTAFTSAPLPAPGTSSPAPGTSALSAPPSPPVTTPPTSAPLPAPGISAPTQLSTQLSSPGTTTTGVGRTVVRTTRLTTVNGATLAGQSVRLQVRPHGAGAWSVFRSAKTDRTGVARFALAPSRNTDLRVTFAGNRQLLASTSPVATLYTRRAGSVTASRTTVHRGTTVHLTSRISRAPSGRFHLHML